MDEKQNYDYLGEKLIELQVESEPRLFQLINTKRTSTHNLNEQELSYLNYYR